MLPFCFVLLCFIFDLFSKTQNERKLTL